ncbi:MAG TPA: gluconate 2-dehydrogenase subunit 3 family protein [Nevskiaceae bacterium]|nr:gluconate 2-dehydrogenase subunit 3 family protein [Nevskiaceae bacterium]
MKLTRRAFVAGAAATAALPLADCTRSQAPEISTAPAGLADAKLAEFAFTGAQRAALTAAVAQLIPASTPGDWSAADAGAVEYIEQLLNGFSADGNPKIYGHGPARPRFAEFEPLSRVKTHGWMGEVQRLRQVYADGLDELNRLARGPLSLLPGDFSALSAPEQIAILESQDLQDTPFFAALFAHTMEGVYGHPVYGGNRAYIAWQTYCYEGDVHGVRFPDGYAPGDDARPWNEFGGYSPDEIAAAPAACSGKGGST